MLHGLLCALRVRLLHLFSFCFPSLVFFHFSRFIVVSEQTRHQIREKAISAVWLWLPICLFFIVVFRLAVFGILFLGFAFSFVVLHVLDDLVPVIGRLHFTCSNSRLSNGLSLSDYFAEVRFRLNLVEGNGFVVKVLFELFFECFILLPEFRKLIFSFDIAVFVMLLADSYV